MVADGENRSGTIIVRELEKRFGDFVAVNRISFSVRPGEIFGFLGSNGSGKSTTIRMLCGILAPTSGEAKVAGHDILTETEEVKHAIGYMSQKFSLYEDLTPFENLRFYLGVYSVPQREWAERIDWVLETTRLKEARDRLTRDIPPGWRQRLALGARCFTALGSSSWTSRPPASIRSPDAVSGISFERSPRRGSPFSSRPITWMRRTIANGSS